MGRLEDLLDGHVQRLEFLLEPTARERRDEPRRHGASADSRGEFCVL
jgi:hypothetical protein